MSATTSKRVTLAEFERIADKMRGTGERCELIDGEVNKVTPASYHHGEISGVLHGLIFQHVHPNGLGKVFSAETGFRSADPSGSDSVRAPDIAFITADRLPTTPPEAFSTVMPDLVVETNSPNDTVGYVSEKVQWWLSHGVQLVWVVDPKSQTLTAHLPGGDAHTYQRDEPVPGTPVLPELTIDLTQVFT